MIAIRNDSSAFSRQADAKIGLLKEVIERVQRGEVVDVAGLLGTGDKSREREWEDVLREIQEEDALWRKRSKKRNKESSAASEDSSHAEKSSVPSNATQLPQESNPEAKKEEVPAQDRGQTPRGYY
ncbi:MAG: hypothetical protein M1837_002747 [Sclerophora amabilis]|nr:MAG: hypothetical protein M1837_002747 [Sclerophora amabilis]